MKPKLTSGTWLVIALLTMGIIAAIAAKKFRRSPQQWPPTTQPATARQSDNNTIKP